MEPLLAQQWRINLLMEHNVTARPTQLLREVVLILTLQTAEALAEFKGQVKDEDKFRKLVNHN